MSLWYDDSRVVLFSVFNVHGFLCKEWVRRPAAEGLIINPDSPFEPDEYGD
jgi:hypothetical protein